MPLISLMIKILCTMYTLTLYFAVSQNGQTHFKTLAANAARFLKCVQPFERVKD